MSRRSRGEASTPVPGAQAPGEELGKLNPTMGIEEAAQLLRMSEDALMRKARIGKVPGAKMGRRWVFVQADLVELIREQARQRVGRPINIRALRTANPFERSAAQLARQIEGEIKNLKSRQPTARQRRRP